METKDVLRMLRKQKNMTQEELATQVFVTRQAVSRWESGETIPNVETLKLLSQLFEVSINTLLGTSQQLYCQCCGMPLEADVFSKESDGIINQDYCKWCYADGEFTYQTKKQLIDFLVAHRDPNACSEEKARAYYEEHLAKLKHWNSTESQ